MMLRTCFLFLLLLVFPKSIFSQSDFGIWYEINTEFKLAKKLDLNVSAVVRTFENASRIDQGFIEGEISYKIKKYLSLEGSYRLIENLEKDSKYHIRNKWMAGVKGSYSVKRFYFTAGLRGQVDTRTYIKNDADKIPDYHAKLKLKVLYKIKKFPLDPFFSYDSFYPLFSNSDVFIDKHRFSLGTEYKFSKNHSIEVEYMYQRDYSPNLLNSNIISICYDIKF